MIIKKNIIFSVSLVVSFSIIVYCGILIFKKSENIVKKIVISILFLIYLWAYTYYYLFIKVIIKSPLGIDVTQPMIPSKNDNEELVVAVCNENVDWIDDMSSEYTLITVYNKCKQKLNFKSDNVKVMDIPNIGSCDYAFLTYIIDRYNNLPEFIEFTKGSSPGDHYYKSCLPCYNDSKRKTPLTTDYLQDIYNFSLKKTHSFGNNPKQTNKFNWVTSKYNNFGEWLGGNKLDLSIVEKNFCNIIFGGHFGTTRDQIKRTPLKVYEALRKEQKYPMEEIDHFIERLWRPLLCRPRYNLVVVGIFKNESVAIREWIIHHMGQGVEHFYLINNGSTDDWKSQIFDLPVTVYSDNEKHKQVDHYNNYFLDTIKIEAKWVMVIDLDEFMYARKGNLTISDVLGKLPRKVSRILVKWKMFGSSGNIEQPPSIIQGFQHRWGIDNDYFEHKCITRVVHLEKFGIHESIISSGDTIRMPRESTEESLEDAPIHLNHYAIQSKNWFDEVKMTRGAADSKQFVSVRNDKYFKDYDHNDIRDHELSSYKV